MEQKFHCTGDQLEQYALGRLSPADVEVVEEHVMGCVACQEKLDRAAYFSHAMREALEDQTPSAVASVKKEVKISWFDWVRRPAFAMTLGFAALILIIGIFSNGRTRFVPSASLQLTAMRGEMPVTVPAREFDLTLSDAPRDGGPFRIEVVNELGLSMWRGLAPSGPDGVHVDVQQKLDAGGYFVRVYSVEGKVLREYGFRVRA